MSKIKNKLYRKFLDDGEIKILNEEDITLVLNSLKSKNKIEARALIICLYYTGGRPNEVLRLKGKDVRRDKRYIIVQISGSKRGLARPIYLPYKLPLIKEFYNYIISNMAEKFLFFNFMSRYERTRYLKSGAISTRIETTDKLRYHINKWFSVLPDTITTYYLRHNRFSKLAMAGIRLEDIRMFKGSRTLESVIPYIHMSTEKARQIGRRID